MTEILLLPQRKTLTRKEQIWAQSVCAGSSCRVQIVNKAEELHAVYISLSGLAAHFPSTSNDRPIKRSGKFFRVHSARTIGRLEGASQLYEQAIYQTERPIPRFETQNVSVLAAIGAKKTGGRWDSHNLCKPLGDWLETVWLINDDSQAEIFVIKKTEYPQDYKDQETTEIIIQRRSNVQVLNSAYYGAIRCAAIP